jgi:uncharacterized membrane protein YfcA
MHEIIIICIAAFITSLLTFFTGFGLGTILTPVFAIFFPIDLAIALTGIVHLLNNLFKLSLIGMKADKQVVMRFGIPAFFAAIAGAYLLVFITDLPAIYTYTLNNSVYSVTPVKLVVAVLLIFFALMESIPYFKSIQFDKDKLVPGGILSGFFGGLSGNQGALRSAFLIRSGLDKEAFIATGIVIACLVDLSRLGIYTTRFLQTNLQDALGLVIAATAAAFLGAYLGNRLLKKITLAVIQVIVTVMLIILSLALASGIL